MNCEFARERMMDELYQELAQPESEDLHRHLRSCPSCHAEWGRLSGTKNFLDSASEHSSVSLDMGRIEREATAREEWRKRRWRTAFWTAAAAAAILLVFSLIRLNVEIHDDRIVLSWGSTPDSMSGERVQRVKLDPTLVETQPDPWPILSKHDHRLEELQTNLYLINARFEKDHCQKRRALETFNDALIQTNLRQSQAWQQMQRDLKALYLVQYPNQANREE